MTVVPEALQHCVADIYADDTTISHYAHYQAAPNAFSEGLQEDIVEVLNWSSSNKMLLNESKTKWMLVTGKRLVKMEHPTSQLRLKSCELIKYTHTNCSG